MTVLRQCLTDYLAIRRALGFKLEGESHLLIHFVDFMEAENATTVTTERALVWATTQTKGGMNWRSSRLRAVRGFARYLQAIDPNTEVPPAGLLPRSDHRASPYIYDDAEICALMAAAQTLRSRMARHTYASLIGLLAVTGMRLGEAIRLDRDDIDWEHGFLTVRRTKFRKSREVALHPTTLTGLQTYSRRRNDLIPRPNSPSFFVSKLGTRLARSPVENTFRRLARQADVPRGPSRRRPRLHDFRHTFAVRTVLQWYHERLDVTARLPLLSTYLGHVHPRNTYWYLSATPELLALAAERLHRMSTGGCL